MTDTTTYQVDLPYANFGIICDTNSMVIQTAPIANWMVMRHLNEAKAWVAKKGGTITELPEPASKPRKRKRSRKR